MKKTNLLIALLVSSALILSCKKKDKTSDSEPTSSTTTTTTGGTPAHVNTFTAVVNGQNWSTVSYLTFHAGYSYGVTGQSANNNPYTVISSAFSYTTGTFALSKFGLYNMRYIDQANTIYKSRNGTLTISELDTSATGGLIKVKATFSFQTDTVNGQTYNLTQGVVDYIKP